MGVGGRLSFRRKFAFGVGQAAEGIQNAALGTFLMFYYNQVLGVSAGMASLAIGVAVIIDAITDPLAGSLSDAWHSKHGRRHPFMYASALPLAICFFLLFNPMVEGEIALAVWLAVFANLTRTSMTLYHVPHLALGAEMSQDFDERSSLVAFRQFFATFGAMATQLIGFFVFFVATAEYPKGQLNPDAYPPFAALFAVLIFVTIIWSAWDTRQVIPFLPQAAAAARLNVIAVFVRLGHDIVSALQNHSFRWLFIGVLIVFVMVGVDGALNLYMNTYFWELTGPQIGLLTPAYAFGLMFGAMAAPWFSGRFGKRFAVMFGTSCWASLQIIPVVLRLLDLFPENGDGWLVPVLFVLRVIQGAGTVQANVAFGSAVADIADEHELRTGRRQEGIFFAASSFSAKCASGFGSIGAGLGLMAIGWPTGSHITVADIPEQTLMELGILYGPIVAGCAVISVWCYSHYGLTRERHAEILAELLARRRAELDATPAETGTPIGSQPAPAR
jgi:Na+/melibiose symporter-like transporter